MSIYVEQTINEIAYAGGINTQKPVYIGNNLTITGAITSTGTTAISLGSYGTATVAGGSVVINAQGGLITTTSLTTGTLLTTSFDLVNSTLGTSPQVFLQVYNGTNTGGDTEIYGITKGHAGSITITIMNVTGGPLNGTLLLDFYVTKS